jgi:predicted CXXCH cytochrome family protein
MQEVKMLGKSRIFILCLLMAGVLFYAHAVRNSTAGIVGGHHDLSNWGGSGFGGGSEEVCVYCHTPHGANKSKGYTNNPNNISDTGPNLGGQFLWNRALPANTFLPYTSDTYTFKGSEPQPSINSLLCLSCHDGIGAMNVLLNYPADWDPSMAPGSSYNQFGDFSVNDPNIGPLNIGGASCTGDTCTGGVDLRNDHPIGFNYDTAQAADSGLRQRTSLPTILQQRLAISGNKVECSTCHDPHLTNYPGQDNMFLVMSNSGSALCLACHIK